MTFTLGLTLPFKMCKYTRMSFIAILSRFGNPAVLASDLGVALSTPYGWAYRGSIPSGYWDKIVTAATLRGITLTFEELAAAAAAPKQGQPPKNRYKQRT
jgi:hypothetical protein